jgi:predicted TIM-barrel fold metal-dependent hydrolase
MAMIDVHAHIGRWPFPIGGDSLANVLGLMEQFDIERAILSSAKAIVYDMQEGNAELAEVLARHDSLLGYVYANPNYLEQSCAEMDRYLSQDRFVGVKIHSTYSRRTIGSEHVSALIAEVARRRVPLLIHTYSAADAANIAVEAKRHPRLPMILAHACAQAWRESAEAAAECPNLYLEFCCSHAERGKVEHALRTCGPRQIVFGTDLDLLSPAFTLGMFQGAGLTPDEESLVFRENAQRILGL